MQRISSLDPWAFPICGTYYKNTDFLSEWEHKAIFDDIFLNIRSNRAMTGITLA